MRRISTTLQALARLGSFLHRPPRTPTGPIPPHRLELAMRQTGRAPLELTNQDRTTPWAQAPDPFTTTPTEYGEKLRAAAASDQLRRNAAVRTLEAKGWTWRGGVEWRPPLGAPPDWSKPYPVDLSERFRRSLGLPPSLHPEKLRADALTDAVDFMLDVYRPDPFEALDWLKDWSEGEPGAVAELEKWQAHRDARRAAP